MQSAYSIIVVFLTVYYGYRRKRTKEYRRLSKKIGELAERYHIDKDKDKFKINLIRIRFEILKLFSNGEMSRDSFHKLNTNVTLYLSEINEMDLLDQTDT
jgi:hypothetical protein